MKEKFISILNAIEVNPVDFLFDENATVPGIFRDEIKLLLKPFGKTKAGCVLCYWQEETAGNNMSPIVWIDSEGTPNAVFSDNLDHFFQMIAYGTGMIYDIIRACEKHSANPVKNPAPETLFENAYVSSFIEHEADKNKKVLVELLLREMNIETTRQPGKEIYNSYIKHIQITKRINNSIKTNE